MTRGTLVLISDEGIFSSIQFNGDMYLEGKGKEVIRLLKDVTTENKFGEAITLVPASYFDEELIFKLPDDYDLKNSFMRKVYYQEWHSDYLYIKNATSEDIEILDFDGKPEILLANELTILNFGTKIEYDKTS